MAKKGTPNSKRGPKNGGKGGKKQPMVHKGPKQKGK
jgi:hypothetical protein